MSEFKVKSVTGDEDLKSTLVQDAKAVETTDAPETTTEDTVVETTTTEAEKGVQTEAPAFDVKGVFGEGYSSLDDVKAELERLKSAPKDDVDDELRSLAEAKKQGWSIDEYLKVVKADYDKVSDADVVKLKMRAEKPHLDAEEIEILYNDKFGFDEEADDEDDVRRAKIRLKDAAFEARGHFKEFQKSYKPQGVKANEVQERAKSQWKSGIEAFNVDELVVKNGDNEVVRYKVSPEKVAELKGELAEMDNYFKGYIKDGALDMNALATDRMKARLFDEVVKAASTSAASKGREEVVERRNNVKVDAESRNPNTAGRTKEQKVLDQLRKAGF
jgi:hypothetical protein